MFIYVNINAQFKITTGEVCGEKRVDKYGLRIWCLTLYTISYRISYTISYKISYTISYKINVCYLRIFVSESMSVDVEGIATCLRSSIEKITFPSDATECTDVPVRSTHYVINEDGV